MTADVLHWWWAQVAALDTPALPSLVGQQIGRSLGWGVLLATALAWVGRGWSPRLRWGAVALLALWCGVPGTLAPAFWLGLAFQAPSLCTVGLCVLYLQSSWAHAAGGDANSVGRSVTLGKTSVPRVPVVLACLGIALGWVLLADTLAWMPVTVYAWGFSPLSLAGLLLVLLLPWAWTGQSRTLTLVLAVSLVVGFAGWRLPTGNTWDAVLDPWLWVFLHGFVVRQWRTRWEKFNRTDT